MDTHADIHLTRSDAAQDPSAPSLGMDHDLDTALDEDLVPEMLLPSNEHLTGGSDNEIRELPSLEGEPSDSQTGGNGHNCTQLQTNFSQMIPKEVPQPGWVPAPAADPQDLPSPCARTAPLCGACPDDHSNLVQVPNDVQSAAITHLTDEEEGETCEDLDYVYGRHLPSLPPSSSPPQLFSSSPCVSSQSSGSDVGPSQMCASPHSSHVVLVSPDDSHLESEDVPHPDAADAPMFLETDSLCSQTGPLTTEGGFELSKRTTDRDEQPFKRQKLDHRLCLPPTPKRATLASQNHQFRKLSAPFRPPLKIPASADGLVQAASNGKIETPTATSETNYDKVERKESTILSQPKAPNTSKPITQFKSPLVNRVLPADARSIRLTPALQALERKLQLLKRAIKVKEDDEEEVLAKLAKKWVEAGREVAYDVWDATKDAGGFEAKATFARRLRGWESADDGNTPWGWDSKPGEGSCDLDTSEAAHTAERLASEEDDDAGFHTLGTMLRQLGIAPEIFGWDDEKEIFSD